MFGRIDALYIRLFYDGVLTAAFDSLSIDPLKIATNAENGRVTVSGEENNGFLGLFELDALYFFLKREVLIWSAIVVLFLLVTMLFINKSEKLADRKDDIMHKLLIVFLASSAISVLSAVINLLDAVF